MSLRTRLRADTRSRHDTVDAMMEPYDVSLIHGYTSFLLTHLLALAHLKARALRGNAADMEADLDQMVGNLVVDLTELGQPAATSFGTALPQCTELHPDALRYVLLGSQIGLSHLQKRWQSAHDPRVRSAGAFISHPRDGDRWRTLCARLSQMPSNGRLPDRIVEDAQTVFDIYIAAARMNSSCLESINDTEFARH